jgi:hypothetical protein
MRRGSRIPSHLRTDAHLAPIGACARRRGVSEFPVACRQAHTCTSKYNIIRRLRQSSNRPLEINPAVRNQTRCSGKGQKGENPRPETIGKRSALPDWAQAKKRYPTRTRACPAATRAHKDGPRIGTWLGHYRRTLVRWFVNFNNIVKYDIYFYNEEGW